MVSYCTDALCLVAEHLVARDFDRACCSVEEEMAISWMDARDPGARLFGSCIGVRNVDVDNLRPGWHIEVSVEKFAGEYLLEDGVWMAES